MTVAADYRRNRFLPHWPLQGRVRGAMARARA